MSFRGKGVNPSYTLLPCWLACSLAGICRNRAGPGRFRTRLCISWIPRPGN